MKAIIYRARGAARDVVEISDLPKPEPAPGHVLVRIHASGVNPSDVKARSGAQGGMTAPVIVPHNDGAGIIEAVGRGVPDSRVGERVWLYNVNRSADGQKQGDRGTAAEYGAFDAGYAVTLPDNVTFNEGACLGVPAMTAHRALLADGPVEGLTVLVTGGAGAVGQMAIQMAKASGAKVITTVSSMAKTKAVKEDGADVAVNYKTSPDLVKAILDANDGEKVDRIVDVDFGVHINLTPQLLKQNGVISTYASMGAPEPTLKFYPLMFNNTLMRQVFVYSIPREAMAAAHEDTNRWLAEGRLKPRIDTIYPLDECARAHEHVESGTQLGNIVLDVTGS